MTLVRFEPFRALDTIGRRMNEFFGDIEKGVSFEMGGFTPRVDLTEDDNNLYVHAELAGMSKDDVKISVSDDRMLVIKGEKKREEKKEENSYIRSERVYGSFSRSFYLQDNVDIEKIDAKFENGVLELVLPKIEPPKPKEIEVKIN